MFKKCFIFLLTLVLCMVTAVCVSGEQPKSDVQTVTGKVFPGIFIKKVDNFLVVFDGSMSMTDEYQGREKLDLAKSTLKQMNAIMPEIDLMAAFRVCGTGNCPEGVDSRLIYGPEYHSKTGLNTALDTIERASGGTPMALSIDGAAADLESIDGRSAVIVVSDGIDVKYGSIKAVESLKQKYGDQVTLYTVRVGDDPKGIEALDKMARAGGSETAFAAAELAASNEKMANFVETVFLTEVFDTDKDGVFDRDDKCPDTPPGVNVDDQGCPIDTDKDGVPDSLDRCSGTPVGAQVDNRGCWTIKSVHFDFDKAQIKSSGYPVLDNVVDVMRKNNELQIIIDGHTDNIGKAEYNMDLSSRRAKSAMNYLVENGIAADRIEVMAFGFTKPATSNDTEEGRAKNRRVEFRPVVSEN